MLMLCLHQCSHVIVFVTHVLNMVLIHQCSGMTEGVWSNVTTFVGHCGSLLSVVLIDGSIVLKV